jgi:NAD(P)-dependent dehydrogenase (short-subunit alcohol dehydrogenase family)
MRKPQASALPGDVARPLSDLLALQRASRNPIDPQTCEETKEGGLDHAACFSIVSATFTHIIMFREILRSIYRRLQPKTVAARRPEPPPIPDVPLHMDRLFSLQGRVALISGASSGIGLHIASVFAQAGAAVALAARRKEKIESAARALAARGHAATAVYLDVTDPQSISPAFDAAARALGAPVDLLFNNAGILYASCFVDQDPAEVARIFDTNLKGSFLVAQEAARRMAPLHRGAIINVASTAALRAGASLSSYSASKAGLIHLSGVMALELAQKGVRVNTLCPGNIETDMHQVFRDLGVEEALLRRIPLGRIGRVDDLDGAALLLAADAGRYITGAVIAVDGGQALSWM